LNDKLQRRIDKLGEGFIDIFHVIGLFMVSITIAWSAFHEYVIIINGCAEFTGGFK